MPYKQIDKAKWDACVANSHNRLLYGFTFYLDKISANWDGLVLNDYEAVMPLPWKKKLQIKYLYQPSFMQQGGIFSASLITSEIVVTFLSTAAEHFSFAEITLNYANDVSGIKKPMRSMKRSNFILDLSNYETVFESFDAAFTKSLRRIKKFGLKYSTLKDHSPIIQLYEQLYNKHLPSFGVADYKAFLSICKLLAESGNLITRVVYTPENDLVAGLVLLKDDKRLYNLISCITTPGKKLEANYFLYNNVIEEFCGRGLLLDLEGSEVPGIAAFYNKMNPDLQPYHFIRYNNLPPILKLFKK